MALILPQIKAPNVPQTGSKVTGTPFANASRELRSQIFARSGDIQNFQIESLAPLFGSRMLCRPLQRAPARRTAWRWPILNAGASEIGNGDLNLACASRFRPGNDLSKFWKACVARGNGVVEFAQAPRLHEAVRDIEIRTGNRPRVNLILVFGVRSHRGHVLSGLQPCHTQDRLVGRRRRGDDMEASQSLSRLRVCGKGKAKLQESSCATVSASEVSRAQIRASRIRRTSVSARTCNLACIPAPRTAATEASLRARWFAATAPAAAVRMSVKGLEIPQSCTGRPTSRLAFIAAPRSMVIPITLARDRTLLSAAATPAASPPPESGTSTVATSGTASTISRPIVPCPAMMSG